MKLDMSLLQCAVVLPSLLYGCERWTCYRRHIKKLDQFHLRCIRRIVGVGWRDFVPNQEILWRAELSGIEAMLSSAQLRWAGHVLRMDDRRPAKQLLHAELSAGDRHVVWAEKKMQGCLNMHPQSMQHTIGNMASHGPGPDSMEGSHKKGH